MKFDNGAAVEAAPAKINLALHILGRRPDRYHDIDSLAVFAEIGDEIEAVPGENGLSVTTDGPFARDLSAAPTERNLVLTAAKKLSEIAGDQAADAEIRLTKNLPVASGLGGGSADAAATLRLFNRVWRLGLAEEELQAIGAEIGSDVPMCVASAPLRATGRGEKLTLAERVPPLPIVLVFPSTPISTAAIFERIGGGSDKRLPRLPLRFDSPADVAAWLRGTRNGLEAAAFEEMPVIGEVLDLLGRSRDCLLARMSGSGSTCFGLFADADKAMRAAGAIRTARPAWWVKPTMTGGSS